MLKTVKICDGDNDYRVINFTDFDKSKHILYVDPLHQDVPFSDSLNPRASRRLELESANTTNSDIEILCKSYDLVKPKKASWKSMIESILDHEFGGKN